ncbi:MAG: cytochrome c-type biogenesis protein CcmH [Vicinamibacterales bacterium]
MPVYAVLLLLSVAAQPASPDAARIERWEAELMAPCCWSQTVDIHHSPAADDVKAELRQLVADGRTDEEIRAAFVAEYGKRILVVPPAEGFSQALYVLPWLLLGLSAAGLTLIVRRFVTHAHEPLPAGPTVPGETTAERDRIDELLERME